MISDLKLGFKILRYAHALKSTSILAVIIVVFGLAWCVLNVVSPAAAGGIPGGYFLMLTGLFMVQLLYSVNMSNLVQASPAKKRLQTSVPAVLSTFCMLAGYLLTVLTAGITVCIRPEKVGIVCGQIIFTVVIMSVVMLYMAVCYKYFVTATVMFVGIFAVCYSYLACEKGWNISFAGNSWFIFVLTAAVGLAAILVCGVLQYFLSLAVYKAPMSKRAQMASLRRQL